MAETTDPYADRYDRMLASRDKYKAEAHLLTRERDEAVAALRRLVAVGNGFAHRYSPIDPASVEIVEKANKSEPTMRQRSLRCWDCDEIGDRLIGPGSDRTWGDDCHERAEALKAAREFLDAVGGNPSGTA